MNAKHSRFKGAMWYPKTETFTMIGGAGGIGSWLTVLLNRAGFKTMVFDFDSLEEHNMSGQLFSKKQIGQPKVNALREVVSEFCDSEIVNIDSAIDESSPTHHYIFSAFDNMKARKIMFDTWYKEYAHGGNPNAIFIDGRLTAEQMQIFCVRASDNEAIKEYAEKYLFDDSQVEDAPCTMKQTSHAAAMIASHMVGFFTNHITNVYENMELRPVPFMWEYFIPMDLLTVENKVLCVLET